MYHEGVHGTTFLWARHILFLETIHNIKGFKIPALPAITVIGEGRMHCSICGWCPPTAVGTLSRRHNGRRVNLITQLHVVRSSSRIKLIMSNKRFSANGATASQVRVSAMFVITDCMKVKIKKVKVTTEKAMKVPRRGRGLALLFL